MPLPSQSCTLLLLLLLSRFSRVRLLATPWTAAYQTPPSMGFTRHGSNGKESACNAGDLGSIPGSGRPLEKGIATHSGILTWRIPWTEEPGGLQSMELQGVRHD